MARPTSWKHLTIGILSACSVLAVALSILVFGRVGMLHGKKFTLFVTADGARGVIRGTEVWLDGQKVGLVTGVSFRSPATSPKERLLLSLTVLDDARPQIRRDTRVWIRSGANIIGDQVVYLASGTAATPAVVDGDTIHAEQTDVEGVTSDAAMASREFPAIMSSVKLLTAQLRTAEGTLGAFGLEGGGPDMQSVRDKTARLMNRLSGSHGAVPLTLSVRYSLTQQASHAMAQVDSIRALVTSNNHSLGRFRRDSTLTHEVSRVRAELADVQRLAASPTGTIGRFRTDSAITLGIQRDIATLDSLVANMKKHPLRYISF